MRTLLYLCIMKLLNKKLLKKHLNKNRGNKSLAKAIEKLIDDFELNSIKTVEELIKIRSDTDKIHPDNFYFFNLKDHRTMILVLFDEDESTILWCGNHDKYELTFKNNKNTIRKWLKSKKQIL